MNLFDQKCVVCNSDIKPLNKKEAEALIEELDNWGLKLRISDTPHRPVSLNKKYKFRNFREAVDFINKVAVVAEEEGHHPDLHLQKYQYVLVEIYTHSIKALSKNDFILAAKIDRVKNCNG